MQIQLIKINIFIVLLVQFLLLQWFLASQKSIFLGFIIVVASAIAFNRMLKEWIFTVLPTAWLFGNLGALFTVVFGAVLNIISSYYKVSSTDPETFKKIVTRSVILAFVFIIIFVTISPWLPQK